MTTRTPLVLLRHTEAAVAASLAGARRVGVAYSGEVESAALLALSVRVMGSHPVVALLEQASGLPHDAQEAALEVAAQLGTRVVQVDEAGESITREEGLDALLVTARHTGVAASCPVHRPLLDAGVSSAEIRLVARALDLPVEEPPSVIHPRVLLQIARAEAILRNLGFGSGEVHAHGDVARVQVAVSDLHLAVGSAREALIEGLRTAGFRHVALDLAGRRLDLLRPLPQADAG